MKLLPLVVTVSISLFIISCSSSKKVAAVPEVASKPFFSQTISVDGKPGDWQNIPLTVNSKNTVQYAMANSDSHLFILLKIQDQLEQMKLLRGGMEIWIDPAGGEAKQTAIVYPVKGELNLNERTSVTPGQKTDYKALRNQMVTQLISLNRMGFKPQYNGVQSIYDNTGFKAAMGWDENDILIYEASIPFAAFTGDIKNDKLALGFVLNGVDRPKDTHGAESSTHMESGGRQMGGRSGRNFNSMRSARSADNSARYDSRQREKIFESESFWTQYTTATN